MYGVGFPRVGDSVCKDEAVLAVDKVLDGLQRSFLEKLLLLYVGLHDFGKGVFMRRLGRAVKKILVIDGAFGRGKEEVVSVGDFDASLILA